MHDHTPFFHGGSFDSALTLPFVFVFFGYLYGVMRSNRHYQKWPMHRIFFFLCGILSARFSVVGPLAQQAHVDFTAHMLAHLLLGMLSPLLVALSRPVTLLLRTLHVDSARFLSRILQHRVVRIFHDPLIAFILNVGGLWLLYTTPFYSIMQQNIILHLFVHIHLFLAGYLLTISMVYFDPTPHRTHFVYRGMVMLFALAGHEILAKYIYAYPPDGISSDQAKSGGLLMYYGGDAIELVVLILFFSQWFRSLKRRKPISANSYIRP
jgi:putative membrane protein